MLSLRLYEFGAAPRRELRRDPRRHEVRVRRARRRDHRDRRDDDARLVALLAARRVPARHVAAVVRQAVRARLHGRDRLEPRTARAAHAAPRSIANTARAIHRGVRAASPARVSTTGTDPTTPEPAACSCRRRSLWWGRARQPAGDGRPSGTNTCGSVDGGREDRRFAVVSSRGVGRRPSCARAAIPPDLAYRGARRLGRVGGRRCRVVCTLGCSGIGHEGEHRAGVGTDRPRAEGARRDRCRVRRGSSVVQQGARTHESCDGRDAG